MTSVDEATKTNVVSIPNAGVDRASFFYTHDILRAVVITFDERLQNIFIVTSEQYI